MMNEPGLQRALLEQSSGSGHSFGTPRHQSITEPILSKRVCFYKSGDPQFSGLRMVINNRTFKTFDALLDSLSKKVPLPFGVRNITTPQGVHAVHTLDELEDGKSYICSDMRKVIPINLAQVRKKLPPWYHARPISSRRRTVQQARVFPGQNIHKKERAVVRTPKRLVVFRNGAPNIKHTVVLDKRITPTFESILEFISGQTQFHVVKLHTLEGRRVDGLPGLILCSGIVVAAGREPFRPANYNVQKLSAAPAMPTTHRTALRRVKSFNRKKRFLSYTPISRKFSPLSERYIVNRIHDSIAGSSCDLTSNPTNSVDMESGHVLESVAESEVDTDAQDCVLPSEDDIEKSFRVNQDGSMTVEMKVRLTIKEEETIHWTTTLSRSSVANPLNAMCLPESEAEQELAPAATIDTMDNDKTVDKNSEDLMSLCNGALSDSTNEDDIKAQTGVGSPERGPTPGHKQIRQKQVSVESIKSVTAEGTEKGLINSFSYEERTEHGAMTEQYCMIKQKSTKPVPKPRRLGSMDYSNINSRNASTLESPGMTEFLQIHSSGEEVTETVLHIYEHQTCQDNFLANISGISFSRPATAGTVPFYPNNEFEPEFWRPSTGSEPVGRCRAETRPVLTQSSLTTGAAETANPKITDKTQQEELRRDKRVSLKPNKQVRQLMSPGKRLKSNSAEATKKLKKRKTFSSAGFLKKIYGNKSKSAKSTTKVRKANGDKGVTIKSSKQWNDSTPEMKEDTSETPEKSIQNDIPSKSNLPQEIVTRQSSVHQEKKEQNESCGVKGTMSFPNFNVSSPDTNEYVESWLEKTQNHTASEDEESTLRQTENGMCGENKNGFSVAKVVKHLEMTPETQTCHTSSAEILPDFVRRGSVKQRIQSFENKLSSPAIEKNTAKQQTLHRNEANANAKTCISLAHNSMEGLQPHSNRDCSEINPPTQTSAETTSGDEKKSVRSIKISLHNATPSHSLSMDLPSPPPLDEIAELSNTEDCMMDVSSTGSKSLYMVSSVSSQTSDRPLSSSPNSSPINLTTEKTASIQNSIPSTPGETPLPRTPSIKMVPSISNLSLDGNMSLRKARLDECILCCDASSTAVNTGDENVLPDSRCSMGAHIPSEAPVQENGTSCCSSAYPTSLESEERMSTASISSSEGSPLSALHDQTTVTQESSPKPVVKKVKVRSNLSPERKSQTSSEPYKKLSSMHNNPQKMMSPKAGIQKQEAPNDSPSTERRKSHQQHKLQARLSPYSQSLDVVSPPMRHKSGKKLRTGNLPTDNSSRQQRRKSSERKSRQPPRAMLSTAEQEKAKKDGSDTVIVNAANQPNMKPVLKEICNAIKSIRQITQNKRASCLERSNSLPDFSSHVASTFGSSSKALLAFLAVMTLKDGITNLNTSGLNANVSCAEPLKMIDSLREIASIEDSHKLKVSLSILQQSASKQLMQSWKNFQEFSNKSRSCSSTPSDPEHGFTSTDTPGKDTDDDIIDEMMDNLDMPKEIKEELASLSDNVRSDSDDTEKRSTQDVVNVRDVIHDDQNSDDVSAIIRKFTHVHELERSNDVTAQEKTTDQETKDNDNKQWMNGEARCRPCDLIDARTEKDNYPSELQMDREEITTVLRKERTHNDKPGSEQEGRDKVSWEHSASRSESGEQHGSEEEPKVECEETQHEKRENDDLSNYESQEETQQTFNYYVELNVGATSAQSHSADIREDGLSNPASPLNSEPRDQRGHMGLNESASDIDEPSTEEQSMAECRELNAVIQENVCVSVEQQENLEEEEHLDDLPDQPDHTNLMNQHSCARKGNNSFIKSDSLGKHCRFSADEDSGNDHNSYEEHAGVEQPKACSSLEEEFDYSEKEFSSEEEQSNRYTEDSSTEYQEALSAVEGERKTRAKVVDQVKCPLKEITSQSIAERVILLEKQVADAQKRTNNVRSPVRCLSQKNPPLQSDGEESELPTSESALGSRSAPQSSLSFSYDSCGVITSEPEGTRVRSIREMFLAKSVADIQQGNGRFPNPTRSQLPQLRAETSVSGGYQSQTSSDLSSGEDDSAQKSITKGFVRRTIERLYGKKDVNPEQEASERPPSVPKEKKKDHSKIFSPFHNARSKAQSELSYFSSTNTVDTLSQAKQSTAFNAQVSPEESIAPENGQWHLQENTRIRKSVSDPAGINKAFMNSPPAEETDEGTEEKTPYSFFSTKSELEDKNSISRKCTYFSLPHANDTDVLQDELNTANGNTITDSKDKSKEPTVWAEKNGKLPAVSIADFKMMDNKVHPIVEFPPDGEVVLAQPLRGHGVVNRRVQEPDVLDLLYDFCGQNCPIL